MIESQLEKLVLDALAHFADTCPYCERELDQAVTLAELRKWLGEQECRT